MSQSLIHLALHAPTLQDLGSALEQAFEAATGVATRPGVLGLALAEGRRASAVAWTTADSPGQQVGVRWRLLWGKDGRLLAQLGQCGSHADQPPDAPDTLQHSIDPRHPPQILASGREAGWRWGSFLMDMNAGV